MSLDTAHHKARMQTVMDGLASGDSRPFTDAMADDFAWVVPGSNAWSGRYEGKKNVLDTLFKSLSAQFSGPYTNTHTRILAEGAIVVVECQGLVVTRRGKKYSNRYCFVCRFENDGLLHELIEYMDTQLVADALEPPEYTVASAG